jgi:hypothetical protein
MLSLLLSVHQDYNITTLQAIQACPRWWAGPGRAAWAGAGAAQAWPARVIGGFSRFIRRKFRVIME